MIFISYSHKDKKIVKPIYENLVKHYGFNKIFYDEEKNKIGDDYWENIKKGIKTCSFFIFFNSKNYNNSASCGKELLEALDRQEEIKILPILLEDNIQMHKSLHRRIYIKFDNDEDVVKKIIESIDNNNFIGFVKDAVFKDLKYFKKNDIPVIKFNLNINLNKVIFLLSILKNSNITLNLINSSGFHETNVVDYNEDMILIQYSYSTCSIYKNEKVEIHLNNYDHFNDYFELYIHNSLGTEKDFENYDLIMKRI